MYHYIYTLLVCTYISINHILKNSNQKTTNFSLSKKFLVISRVDFRERERERIVTLAALTEFSGGNM